MARMKKPAPKRQPWSPFRSAPRAGSDAADFGSRYRRGPGGALITIKPHGPEYNRP